MKRLILLLTVILCYFISAAQPSITSERNIALQLVARNISGIGITADEMMNSLVSSTYQTKEGIRMVYLQQGYRNIPVYNQMLVLAFKGEQLVSKAGSYIPSIAQAVNIESGVPQTAARQAVLAALADRNITAPQNMDAEKDSAGKKIFGKLGVSSEDIKAELVWFPVGKQVRLTWQVEVAPLKTSDMWMIRVDAANNRVLGKNNLTVYDSWHLQGQTKQYYPNFVMRIKEEPKKPGFLRSFVVSSASYRVVPYPAESPNHPGGTPIVVTDPWTMAAGNATSLGWHFDNNVYHDSTRGNNVWAQEDRDGNNNTFGRTAISTTAQPNLNFDFLPDFTTEPTTTSNNNQKFSLTNLFYWNNIIHDISYLYGFDEVAGNFQANNQGRGGAQNDYVIADAQDASGLANANFNTPPDGTRPRMQMFLFPNPTPDRDGDLDNGVVSHEFTHGVSNRLTGGPANVNCLDNAEQGGEGWSDFFALMVTTNWSTANLTDGVVARPLGTYVLNQPINGGGIRIHPYSTDMITNPWTYALLAGTGGESHDIGEIWCTALWEMTWEIIAQTGSINPNLFNPNGAGGNSIALKLVMEGMRLQPCSPGFIDARNAILKADTLLFGAQYSCSIWKAFAKRGMGRFASQGSSNSTGDQVADFTVDNSGFQITQNVQQVPELQNIIYNNRITTGNCTPISNFFVTDTLPTSVTWVSGGTYNAGNRTVTFSPVTLGTNQSQNLSFTVNVNAGTYFTPVDHLNEAVTVTSIPPTWTATSTVAAPNVWSVSTTQGHSAPNSFFAPDPAFVADEILATTNSFTLTTGPGAYSTLSFWHRYIAEAGYDGGVVEISTNGGGSWQDLGSKMIRNGYNGFISPSDGSPIPGRAAFTGNSPGTAFLQTIVNLSSFAGQTVKIRFRFAADGGVAGGGWFVDDILLRSEPAVYMKSNLFNASNVRQGISDTVTYISNPCIVAGIGTQPANTHACAGGNASISVTATGSLIVYKWQVNTGSGFVDLTNTAPYSGVATATLTITGVTAGMDGYLYRCVVTNGCSGLVNSNAATLTLDTPAGVSGQPANSISCAGTATTFTVTGTGPALAYQWQVNPGSGFVDIPNTAPYSGVNTATLTITNIAIGMNGFLYRCVVSNACTPAISNSATLTVNAALNITTQPDNAAVCTGNNGVFTIAATGTTVTYQWQVNTGTGFVDLTNVAPYAGVTTNTLTITTPSQAMSGYLYRCVVSSPACSVSAFSNTVTLSVDPAPGINLQPLTHAVCSGNNTTFTIGATGSVLSYKWQVNTGSGFVDLTNIAPYSGVTTTTLTITATGAVLNGNQYRCILTGACNVATSNPATLTVNVAPNISGQPSGTTLCPGSNFNLNVTASGTGLNYDWQVSTNGGGTWTSLPGGNIASIVIAGVTTGMNGNQYRCVITGTCPPVVTTNVVTLGVLNNVAISAHPSNTAVCEGTTANFAVTATGTALIYHWQFSTNGGTTWNNVPGDPNTPTIAVNATILAQSGTLYHCVVTGTCTTVTSSAGTLTVNPAPQFTISASTPVCLSDTAFTLNTTLAGGIWVGTGVQGSKFNPGVAGLGNASVAYTVMNQFGCTNTRTTNIQVNECVERHRPLDVKDAVKIYPNPNTGKFIIKMNSDLYNKLAIKVYSADGRYVYDKAFTGLVFGSAMNIDLRHLQDGVYMIYMYNDNGNNLIHKTMRIVIAR